MRDKVKKTVKHTVLALCIVLVSVFVISSCDKLQRLRIDELAEAIKNMPCDCIMDTLKGEWVWFRSYGGFGGASGDNRFKSVIKILGQNNDGSINYEVWVRDTLFELALPIYGNNYYSEIFIDDTLWSQGSFQIQHNQWSGGSDGHVLIELPHDELVLGRGWNLYIRSLPWLQKPSKDTLIFGNHAISDGFYYFYKRVE